MMQKFLIATMLVFGLEWSGLMGRDAQAQITRSFLPVDMLNIPVDANNVPYPVTARSGAGSTCTDVTMNTAITAIGATRATLPLVPRDGAGAACTWTLAGNVTTNANTYLLIEAPVVVNAGFTLTINGAWFSTIGPDWYSGAGTVTFNEIPWGNAEAFSTFLTNFIRSGGLHGTSGSLISPPFATRAWVDGRDINEPSTTIAYACAANDIGWTIISSDNDGITGWTRVGTTAYYYLCQGDTTPNQPVLPANSAWLMQVTVSGSAITAVASLLMPDTHTSVDARRFGGTTAAAKINAALRMCATAGCTVDARGFTGTQTLNTNIWDGITAANTVLFGHTIFTTSVTQIPPSYTAVQCALGGGRIGTSAVPISGTIFRWTGAVSTPMLTISGVNHVHVTGCTFDAQSTAGSTGILLEGTATVESNFNILDSFTVWNAAVGVQVGTSPTTDRQVDGLRISNCHVRGTVASAKGIVFNSGNSGQWSRVSQCAFQVINIGIDIQEQGGLLALDSIVCGSLSGTTPACIKAGLVNDSLTLTSSQSESGSAGKNFLWVTPLGSSVTGSITLIANKIDEPITIDHTVNIISMGNYGPSTGVVVINPVAAPRIISIGDTFNDNSGWPVPGAADLYQVLILGNKAVQGANSLWPVVWDASIQSLALSLRSSALDLQQRLTNYAAGGQAWELLTSGTGGTLGAGYIGINDVTNTKTPLVIGPNVTNSGRARNALLVLENGAPVIPSYTFATLPTTADNGSIVVCSNCAVGSPCVAGGGADGRLAVRIAGTWVCR